MYSIGLSLPSHVTTPPHAHTRTTSSNLQKKHRQTRPPKAENPTSITTTTTIPPPFRNAESDFKVKVQACRPIGSRGRRHERIHHSSPQACNFYPPSTPSTPSTPHGRNKAEQKGINHLIFLQVHGVSFKKRAPKAIKEIKAFATKSMVHNPTDLIRPTAFSIQTNLLIFRCRAPKTSASTLNSTRKSGNVGSRASPSACACGSRANVTTRRMQSTGSSPSSRLLM